MKKQLVGTVTVISMMLLAFWTSYNDYASRGLVFKNTVPVDSDTHFASDIYKENLFAPTVLYNNTFYKSVVQYIHDQSLVEKCSNRRYIIYRCNPGMLCRGIGDRQKGIITSFIFALLTNRTFIVDVSTPCKLETILRPSLYDWTICKEYALTMPAIDSMSLNLLGNFKFRSKVSKQDFSQWNKTVVILMLNWLSFSEIRRHNITKAVNLLTNISNEDAIKVVLDVLFKPGQSLETEIDTFYRNQRMDRQLVCAHIRTGGNPSIPRDWKSGNRKPTVSTVFTFLKQFDQPENVIYIATDADEVKKYSYLTLRNAITLKRKIVHVDLLGHMPKNVACEGYFTALLEQYILARCDILILTHSNFGFMAAYQRGIVNQLFLYNQNENAVQRARTLEDIDNIYAIK